MSKIGTAQDSVPLKKLSTKEMAIMMTLWNADGPKIAKDIANECGLNWRNSALQTQLNRLEEKGWLKSDKKTKPYLYTPTLSKKEYREREANYLLAHFFDGSLSNYIKALLKYESLTDEVRDELKKMLDEKTP